MQFYIQFLLKVPFFYFLTI